MQIIIVQAEIETAIRNHILSQINVKEGMEIDIDLSATRGADGFKATIDIRPSNKPSVITQQPVVAPQLTAQAMPLAVTPLQPVLTSIVPVAVEAPTPPAQAEAPAQAKADDFEEDAPVSERLKPFSQAAEQPQPAMAMETNEPQVEAEAPKPSSKSLFKSLRKVTN